MAIKVKAVDNGRVMSITDPSQIKKWEQKFKSGGVKGWVKIEKENDSSGSTGEDSKPKRKAKKADPEGEAAKE